MHTHQFSMDQVLNMIEITMFIPLVAPSTQEPRNNCQKQTTNLLNEHPSNDISYIYLYLSGL